MEYLSNIANHSLHYFLVAYKEKINIERASMNFLPKLWWWSKIIAQNKIKHVEMLKSAFIIFDSDFFFIIQLLSVKQMFDSSIWNPEYIPACSTKLLVHFTSAF